MSERTVNLEPYLISGRLPCSLAFRAAGETGLTPAQIREAADRADVRISRCQLGLFGFEEFGEKRLFECVPDVSEDLRTALLAAAVSKTISCADAWTLADDLGVPRLLLNTVASRLDLRIVRCQLGCFT
jgi:hypothetical protein